MSRAKRKVTLQLPNEFLELCDYDMISPERVMQGFIADICGFTSGPSGPRTDGYHSNGYADRDRARAYYERLHACQAQWIRNNVPHLDTQKQAPVIRSQDSQVQ